MSLNVPEMSLLRFRFSTAGSTGRNSIPTMLERTHLNLCDAAFGKPLKGAERTSFEVAGSGAAYAE